MRRINMRRNLQIKKSLKNSEGHPCPQCSQLKRSYECYYLMCDVDLAKLEKLDGESIDLFFDLSLITYRNKVRNFRYKRTLSLTTKKVVSSREVRSRAEVQG